MAIKKRTATKIRIVRTDVTETQSVLKSREAGDERRTVRCKNTKVNEAAAVEDFLTRNEKKHYKHMTTAHKKRLLRSAHGRQEQEEAVRKSEAVRIGQKSGTDGRSAGSGTKEAAENGATKGVGKSAEAGVKAGGTVASGSVAAASGGTSEAVRIPVKAIKKAADEVKRSAKATEYARESQMREQASSDGSVNSAHSGGILKGIMSVGAMATAAMATAFMGLVQIVVISLLPLIIVTSIVGGIFGGLSDEDIFPDPIVAEVDDETLMAVFTAASEAMGTPYLMGGETVGVGIDCSAFTRYCFREAGVELPRTAQGQYDVSRHFKDEADALPGDLVFFTKTYKAGRTVTHVEIYLGDGLMIGAGDPVRIHDLHSNYYQEHFYSFGRVLEMKEDNSDERTD